MPHFIPNASVYARTLAEGTRFTANLLFVFHPSNGGLAGMAGKFLLVTATSSYVIQSAVIYAASRWPLFLEPIAEAIGQGVGRSAGWVIQNEIKALAVGVGLLWNFIFYKFIVFI